jgi:hypothetical protein
MAVSNNNKAVIDLPTWELLQPMPAASAVGVTSCSDARGSSRYIYILISATSFWRYDCMANTYQQLASPPGGTVGAGTALLFDPSRGTDGYVWAFISNGTAAPTWQYYDCAANTWTARVVTNLPATFGTDSALTHCCTTYNDAGDDDKIYLIGNAGTAWYVFSITGNSWTAMGTPITAAAGAGCAIHWLPSYNTDKLIILRGGATANVYEYAISTPGFVTRTIVPATETFTTGTMSIVRYGTSKIIIQKDNTMRLYELDISTLKIQPLCTQYLQASGNTHVGDRLRYAKTVDGIEFLYVGLHTSSLWLRTALIF